MAEQQKEPKKEKRKGAGAIFIPAGLFIGMGIGGQFPNFCLRKSD